jgi:peptidyl-prolyl cis-trans isomerase SurA
MRRVNVLSIAAPSLARRGDPEVSNLKLIQKAAAALLILAMSIAIAQAQVPAGKARAKSAAPAPAPVVQAAKPATPPAASAAPGGTAAERLDGIAAVVNDDVILQSDVEEQLFLYFSQMRVQPESTMVDSMRSEVLNQLVDFRLVVAEAKRLGMTLTPSDQKMIAQQAEESLAQTRSRFQTEEEFRQALQRDNTSEAKLREKYKSDLGEQVLAQRVRDKQIPEIKVAPAEAEAYFKANPGRFPKVPAQVKLQVIQIPPAADSVADAQARAKILVVRKRLTTGGEKFAKVAAEVSEDDNTARSGGDLGFVAHGTLDVALDTAVAAARLNVLSGPVRSTAGWHLFEVLERDTAKTVAGQDSLDHQGQPLLESHLRHILIRVPLDETDIARARALAEKVRADALKGTDFGALARRYSKYQGNVDPDGDLGYVSMAAFQPNIRASIDSVAVGGVSSVIENPVGYNLFKVNDRKPERPYQFEEIKDQLPRAVKDIKDGERWDAWVKQLRSKAHVEIRGS